MAMARDWGNEVGAALRSSHQGAPTLSISRGEWRVDSVSGRRDAPCQQRWSQGSQGKVDLLPFLVAAGCPNY